MRSLETLAEHLKKVGEDTAPYWRSLSHKHTGDDISWQEDVMQDALDLIKQQKVMNQDVQNAIYEMQSAVRISAWHNSDYVDTPIKDKTLRIALTALCQMKQPCSIILDDPEESGVGQCSKCEFEIDVGYGWNYCPDCGGALFLQPEPLERGDE